MHTDGSEFSKERNWFFEKKSAVVVFSISQELKTKTLCILTSVSHDVKPLWKLQLKAFLL